MPNNDKNDANEEAKRKADEEELRCDEEVDDDFIEEESRICVGFSVSRFAPVNEAMKKVNEEAKRKAAAEEARRRTAAEAEEAPRKAEVDSVVERLHKYKEARGDDGEGDRERLMRLPAKKRLKREEEEDDGEGGEGGDQSTQGGDRGARGACRASRGGGGAEVTTEAAMTRRRRRRRWRRRRSNTISGALRPPRGRGAPAPAPSEDQIQEILDAVKAMRKAGNRPGGGARLQDQLEAAQTGDGGASRRHVRDRPARRHEDRLGAQARAVAEGRRDGGAEARARAEPAAEAAATEVATATATATATEAATAGATAATAATEKEEDPCPICRRSWRRSRCTPSLRKARSLQVHLEVGRHLPRTAALPVLLDAVQRDWLGERRPRTDFDQADAGLQGAIHQSLADQQGALNGAGVQRQPADRARRVVAVLKHLGDVDDDTIGVKVKQAGQGAVSAQKRTARQRRRRRPHTNGVIGIDGVGARGRRLTEPTKPTVS